MATKKPIVPIQIKDVPKELLNDKLITETLNKFDGVKKEQLKNLYIKFYRMRMQQLHNELHTQDEMSRQEEEVRQEDTRNYASREAGYDPSNVRGISSADIMEKGGLRDAVGMIDKGKDFTSFSESVVSEMHDIINNSNYNPRILLRNFVDKVNLLAKGKYVSNRITKYFTGEAYTPEFGEDGFDYFTKDDPKEYLKTLINGLPDEETKIEARNTLNNLLKQTKKSKLSIKDVANQVKQNEIDRESFIDRHSYNGPKKFAKEKLNFSKTWYKNIMPDWRLPGYQPGDFYTDPESKGWAPNLGRQIFSGQQDVKPGGVPLSIDSAAEEIVDNAKEYTREKISFVKAGQKGITSYKKVQYLDSVFNHLTRAATNTNTMLQRFVLDTDWDGVRNKDPEAVKEAARFYNEVMDSHLSVLKAKNQFMGFVQRNGIINDENFQIRYAYEVPTKNGSKVTIEMGRRYTPAPLELMAKILVKTSNDMIEVSRKATSNITPLASVVDDDTRALNFARKNYAKVRLAHALNALNALEKRNAPNAKIVAMKEELLKRQSAFDKLRTVTSLENFMSQVHAEANISEFTSLENFLKDSSGYDPRIAHALEQAAPVDFKILPHNAPSVVQTLIGHSELNPAYKAIFQRQLKHTHGCAI